MSNASSRSHTHDSPPSWQAISDSSRSRTGSATALNSAASSSAPASGSGSHASGAQHWPSVGVDHRQQLLVNHLSNLTHL